jgi:signal transduction histidine kinase
VIRGAWVPVLVAAIVAGVAVERVAGVRGITAAADVLAGVALVAAGAYACGRRSSRRAGALSVLAGVLWIAGDLAAPLVYAHRGPVVHLLVGHPGARVRGRAAAGVVVAAYVDGLVPALARAELLTLALVLAIVAVLAARLRSARGPARRDHMRALAAGVLVGGSLGLAAVGRGLGIGGERALLVAYCLAVAAAAVALALARRRGAALVELVVDLGTETEGAGIRAAVARALGDPGLRLAFCLSPGVWVDEFGRPFELPVQDANGRRVTVVGEPDQPLAALIHDPAVVADERLLTEVAAAARVAITNVRLAAEVAERVRDVAASRRRLVVAATEQRRRLGEELERGAGRRLQVVASDLRRLAGAPAGAAAVRALADDVGAATQEVRLLAHGVHPRALTERGLAAALRERTAISPLPITLDVPATRMPAEHEATLFFACVEALTNAAKHARASHVDVRVRAMDADVVLTVADDGVGGADTRAGFGLRGLVDRVDALGGRVDVDSVSAHGTRISVELPLA